MSRCQCGKEITWARTEKGKMMPCDMDGRVVQHEGETVILLRPHWASCPRADLWRRRNQERIRATSE
jgi:hypothetical protein